MKNNNRGASLLIVLGLFVVLTVVDMNMLMLVNAGDDTVNKEYEAQQRDGFTATTRYSYYLFDCYAMGTFYSGLIGSDTATGTTAKVWQAKDEVLGDGYFSRSVFEQLCTKFGLDAGRWSDGDMVANVKYLMSGYKYEADAPEGSNYVFSPADPEVEHSVNTITWDISDTNYLSANGMEIALYPMDMTEEEILADTDGTNAYLKLTASFTGTRIPASTKVTVAEENLPEEDTEYRIVLRTLGYSIVSFNSNADSESAVIQITEDSPRVLEGETIVLTAGQITSVMMLNDEMLGCVSDGNSAVSDGNFGGTVSSGNVQALIRMEHMQLDTSGESEEKTVSDGNVED